MTIHSSTSTVVLSTSTTVLTNKLRSEHPARPINELQLFQSMTAGRTWTLMRVLAWRLATWRTGCVGFPVCGVGWSQRCGVTNPRRSESTAGDAGCHPGNRFGEEPRMARMFADKAGDRTVLNCFGGPVLETEAVMVQKPFNHWGKPSGVDRLAPNNTPPPSLPRVYPSGNILLHYPAFNIQTSTHQISRASLQDANQKSSGNQHRLNAFSNAW